MPVALFDIDGTLTKMSEQHDICFVRAVQAVLGEGEFSWDWSDYPYVSDSGILHELFTRRYGRPPTDRETRDIQQRYQSELERDGGAGEAIPGAHQFVDLLENRGWRIVIATGNWTHAGRWKLRAAGFDPRWPMGSADDAMDRVSILKAALKHTGEDDASVYLGDGKWDREAAQSLGLHFVAVGGLEHTHRLDDYTDRDRAYAAVSPT